MCVIRIRARMRARVMYYANRWTRNKINRKKEVESAHGILPGKGATRLYICIYTHTACAAGTNLVILRAHRCALINLDN